MKKDLLVSIQDRAERLGGTPPYSMSTAIAVPELPDRAGALPERLQEIARSYLGARQRSGEALLESARWLSEARAVAIHGQWGVFLEATGTSDDTAERLLNIHTLAMQNPQFADFVRSQWIGQSAAALLSAPSTPSTIVDQVLSAPEPPTVAGIKSAIKEAKAPAPAAPFWQSMSPNHPTAHLWTRAGMNEHHAACGMVTQRAPSGSTDAGHCSSCVRAAWPQNQPAPARPAEPNTSTYEAVSAAFKPAYEPPAAPDLPDILKRLDAHGYARTSTREKGITTFYSFHDYSGRSDETGGEVELAEGELPLWLSELDSSASYALAKQERFINARDRAEKLGYDLRRDGAQFVLTPAGQKAPALVGTLDQQIKTIEGYEKNAAKKAAAAPVPTMAELDSCMPKTFEAAGYYWKSADPLIVANNDGWTGQAGTIATAISLVADREKARAAAQVGHARIGVQHAAETFAALGGDHNPEQQPKGEYPFWDDTAIALDLVFISVEERNRQDAIDRGMAFLMGLIAGRRDDIMLKAWWHFTRMLLDPDVFSDLPLGDANPRRDMALLLRQLEPLMKDVRAEDLEGLSQAISDLNECQEGTEAAHWLTVGYALLDLEKE